MALRTYVRFATLLRQPVRRRTLVSMENYIHILHTTFNAPHTHENMTLNPDEFSFIFGKIALTQIKPHCTTDQRTHIFHEQQSTRL